MTTKRFRSIIFLVVSMSLLACTKTKQESKGFQVSEIIEDESGNTIVGLQLDSLHFETKPSGVLLTAHKDHRLVSIYKVNYNKKDNSPFIGSNSFHYEWYDHAPGNQWNSHIIPGFEALYGYNLVNVAHFNHESQLTNHFFDQVVLIKTLYYPSFESDTLNFEAVQRTHYMVSVFDEDTNKDGFITSKDLRRFYAFDLEGKNKTALIPKEYNVISSEYDSANDYLYVGAVQDLNHNGQTEDQEPVSIFWIDMKQPDKHGKLYPMAANR